MTALVDNPPGLSVCLVKRDFHASGVTRRPGEVVDSSSWRNTAALVTTGYLTPYEGDSVERGGRLWRDTATADRFAPPERPTKLKE